MLKRCHISTLFVVNDRALRIHRAWSRCGSTDTTKSQTGKSPRNPVVILNPRPLKLNPKKLPAFVHKVDLENESRSLAFKLDYLGFRWDPLNGVVSLTEEERSRCLQAVKKGLASIGLPGTKLRELIAILHHACHVVVPGRRHLKALVEGELCGSKVEGGEKLLPDKLIKRMKQDLEWWQDLLEKKRDATKISDLQKGKVATRIYTDASTWGLAMSIDGKWSNRTWKEGLNLDVNWAEATALEVAIRHLATKRAKGSHFTIKCDSSCVVDGWTKGVCNPQIQPVMLSILHVLLQHGCWLSLKWIPSNENRADQPSRSMTGLKLKNRLECDFSRFPKEILEYFREIGP